MRAIEDYNSPDYYSFSDSPPVLLFVMLTLYMQCFCFASVHPVWSFYDHVVAWRGGLQCLWQPSKTQQIGRAGQCSSSVMNEGVKNAQPWALLPNNRILGQPPAAVCAIAATLTFKKVKRDLVCLFFLLCAEAG